MFTTFLLVTATTFALPFTEEPTVVDFNRDIRPILSDACFACHGPDANERQADLRLDEESGLFRTLDEVTIVQPGDIAASELVNRIHAEDSDLVMPPPETGRRLTTQEKTLLEQWIQQGAPYSGHWAYLPPQSSTQQASIDDFVDAEIARRDLQKNNAADAVTLVRRLSFDLTGLPPTPQQVLAYQAEPTPQNWKKLVNELLSSPAHAERMTTFWLDLVRYADTNGIHGDNHREVWMYRDWVIHAFRNNMPFDQFTIEQIAGDLLPNVTDDQKIASGYNRLLMTTREGGAQPKEYLAKYSADRVRNASTVWLGATMGCCECHDHKFDPYTIKDFYEFAAFFSDIKDVPVGVQPSVKMPSPEQRQQQQTLKTQLDQLQKVLDNQTAELDESLQAWATELQAARRSDSSPWKYPEFTDLTSTNGQSLKQLPDGSVKTSGKHPPFDTYRLTLKPNVQQVAAVRLAALPDESFVRKSLSRRPGNGNFVLTRVVVHRLTNDGQTAIEVPIQAAKTTFQQKGWPVVNTLNNDDNNGWAVEGHVKTKAPIAVFQFAKPIKLKEDERLQIELIHKSIAHHNIGRFRIQLTEVEGVEPQGITNGVPADLLTIIDDWSAATPDQKAKVAKYYRTIAPELAQQRKQHADTKRQLDQLQKQIPETLITQTQTSREIRILNRGDWMDDTGAVVNAKVPHFLPELSSVNRLTRLDLAEWFVDDGNPLVARVFVNRLWKIMFGQGIVKTADDFGSQGAWPTHPELLDWLALEFRNSGWNVRHVIRLIAVSEAYQRSSDATAEQMEADPFNQWLARQSRFRLDAEFIRDNALAVSGLLTRKVGGRSVKPYQPEGYWKHLNFPKRAWKADEGADQYRRGLYTYWCRTFLHPAMRSFDAPTREECSVDRPASNNSLQALVLLNDPSYVEAARVLAENAMRDSANDQDIMQQMLKTALSRTGNDDELRVLTTLLDQQRTQFQSSPKDARKLIQTGSQSDTALSDSEARELAAWTAVARVVMNLHEAITRR